LEDDGRVAQKGGGAKPGGGDVIAGAAPRNPDLVESPAAGAKWDDAGASLGVEGAEEVNGVVADADASVGLVGLGVGSVAAEAAFVDWGLGGEIAAENVGDAVARVKAAGGRLAGAHDGNDVGAGAGGTAAGVDAVGAEALVITQDGEFGVLDASHGAVVGGLAEVGVGDLAAFVHHDTREAEGDDCNEQGGENNNVERDGAAFGFWAKSFHKHIISSFPDAANTTGGKIKFVNGTILEVKDVGLAGRLTDFGTDEAALDVGTAGGAEDERARIEDLAGDAGDGRLEDVEAKEGDFEATAGD